METAFMTTIISGRFAQQTEVQHAISALVNAGFDEEHISAFYVNPPGQHDLYPIGGDRDQSPGAEHSGRGTVAGGVVGAAIGGLTTPMTGPVGPIIGTLVGAHLGSLVGTLSQMDDAEQSPPLRHSGMLVAVEAAEPAREEQAAEILRSVGAQDMERMDGTITDGDWSDFNPLSAPAFLDQRPG
jgi:hypothetical protein